MKCRRVVLDTNILVAAARSREGASFALLQALREGRFCALASVPLMLDRDSDFVTSMLTSLHAFTTNTGVLLLWAATIVALTLLGFATLLFGLVVIMPILGHASWHAYRDLVE